MIRTLLLGLALTVFAATSFAQQTPAEPATPKTKATHVFTEALDDHAVGSEDAPMLMHVYASVTCPHCGSWFSKDYPEVKAKLIDTGIVRMVFRELPTPPSDLSMVGFLMAECAPSETYMDVVVYQMQNQETIFAAAKAGNAKAEYDKVAKMAGMDDAEAITACLTNPDMVDHIFMSQTRASAAGVRGVPAVFVNGEAFDGDLSAKTLISVLTKMDAEGVTQLPKTLPRPPAHDHSSHGGGKH